MLKHIEQRAISATFNQSPVWIDLEKYRYELPENLVTILNEYEIKVVASSELDRKSDILLELRNILLEFSKKETLSESIQKSLIQVTLTICMYADLYKGLYWLGEFERTQNQESKAICLYTAVDCLEGGIYRMRQVEQLEEKNGVALNLEVKSLIRSIFLSAILENNKIPEQEELHNTKTAIRRTTTSGLFLLDEEQEYPLDAGKSEIDRSHYFGEWQREKQIEKNQAGIKSIEKILAQQVSEDEENQRNEYHAILLESVGADSQE